MTVGGELYAIFDKKDTSSGPEHVYKLPTDKEYKLKIDFTGGKIKIITEGEDEYNVDYVFDQITGGRERDFYMKDLKDPA
jgi:hypothetical protein